MVYKPCPECGKHNHHNKLKCAKCGACLHAHNIVQLGMRSSFHYKCMPLCWTKHSLLAGTLNFNLALHDTRICVLTC